MSAAKLAVALARRPDTTGRRMGGLATELARIGAGTSSLAPATRDRRFADPAWMQNPLLRRIVQAYLAAGRTAEGWSARPGWAHVTTGESASSRTILPRRCQRAMCRW